MTSTVTDNVLRALSAFRAENGCAISLYIDLDPSSTATAARAETKFNSLVSELEKAAETHGADAGLQARAAGRPGTDPLLVGRRVRPRRDARASPSSPRPRTGTSGALPLPEPVPDVVRIGSELAVAPLVGQLGRDGSLVAVVSRERGTVYRVARRPARRDRRRDRGDAGPAQSGRLVAGALPAPHRAPRPAAPEDGRPRDRPAGARGAAACSS